MELNKHSSLPNFFHHRSRSPFKESWLGDARWEICNKFQPQVQENGQQQAGNFSSPDLFDRTDVCK